MKCLVFIPSKGRTENITKFVLPFMSRLKLDYKIFVEPQDASRYKFSNVEVIGENDKGLGYSTLCAKAYATANGYDLMFRVDDDVKGIGAIENDISKILAAFKFEKVGAVVFPYSFEFYSKSEKLFTRVNKRSQTCYIIRTSLFRPSEKVSTFDDFYQYLLLRTDGYDTLLCSRHLIECAPVGKGAGGLQSFNREELAKKEIAIFRAIDPSIEVITKLDKPWKYEPKFTHKKYKSRAI
jgi:hypothetical protein